MSIQGCHNAQELLQSDQAQEKAEVKPQDSCFSLIAVSSRMRRKHLLLFCGLECCVGLYIGSQLTSFVTEMVLRMLQQLSVVD